MSTEKIKICIDKVSVRNIIAEKRKIEQWIWSDELQMNPEDRKRLENHLEKEVDEAFRRCFTQKGVRR